MSFIQWCERGAKSHVAKEGRGRRRSRDEEGNQGVGDFSFVNIYNFFLFISFFQLLYFIIILYCILFLLMTFTDTHDPRHLATLSIVQCPTTYHSDVAERRKRLEAVGWNSGYNVTPKKRRNGGHVTPHALSCAWVINLFLTIREFPGILSLGPDTSDTVKETAKTSVPETQNSVIFRRGKLRVFS